ncbi:MAG: 2-C-methyl-D-erythritol 2,4-cyclodiphosphate synthase [Candidatus Zixiibacteriota bacterium]|nr:MAG: 2-C-methyl-D-erythritol 2,4-cyclodiphosphate synthase [candidate division Zixibacteria bacterium]
MRVGHGFDVHPLVKGRELILGGVKIPSERGLGGHSDADVLLHAVMDALLGAAGLPDIGQQFPPSDEKYKDADSAALLAEVLSMVRDAGFNVILNVDAILIAQEPKLAPYIPQMKSRLAEILGIEESRVGLKATTTERMGFVGRGEGIAASAICLVSADG